MPRGNLSDGMGIMPSMASPDYAPFSWADQLGARTVRPPRPLTLPELRRLRALGFPETAARLATSTCAECGLLTSSRTHHATCVKPREPRNPLRAMPQPRQPWEPRVRRAA